MKNLTRKYPDGKTRCYWPGSDSQYIDYHDTEWGVELRGDNELFEKISLEGFQAGLSWLTILRRREGFRKAFRGFVITKVASFTDRDVERLVVDSAIIRNRAKILSTINNAKIAKDMDQSLTELIWQYRPKRKTPAAKDFSWQVSSEEAEALSKKLKSLGFSFVGATTMYAMMQSIGMLNDHAPGCFRRSELRG